MKNYYYSFILMVAFALSSSVSAQSFDSLSMGPGYINDIYYSLENGEVGTAPRDNWTIAFYTPRFSAGIIINEGFGVKVFTYPNGDTSAWATVDTAGMTSWKQLYNSPTVWEDGAFNRNALNHPDYGWGVYNDITHNLTGDSLYVVEIPGVGFKKLWIVEKLSIDDIYNFKYANLDGSGYNEVSLNALPYTSKRFIYYSMVTNETIDREPDAETYDIQFTKYTDIVFDNEGTPTPYPVTGVANNVDIGSNNAHPVGPDYNDWTEVPFDSLKNSIGYDWKSFDMGTFSWKIVDSNYYFVQNYAGDVYKLQFLSWGGSQTGNFSLTRSIVSLASVEDAFIATQSFDVYPNPATNNFTIKANIEADFVTVTIYDQTGRKYFQENISSSNLNSGYSVGNIGLAKGLYIISLSGDKTNISQKILIK
ncbi:MAG TPA: T9SS type A sorting domain-containing protein [Bacteroidales bacterium]